MSRSETESRLFCSFIVDGMFAVSLVVSRSEGTIQNSRDAGWKKRTGRQTKQTRKSNDKLRLHQSRRETEDDDDDDDLKQKGVYPYADD